MFGPERLYGDVLKRNASVLPKKLDLYVAGFPCPVFSTLSSLTGRHQAARPLRHFAACVTAIRACRPTAFVLENVPALVKARGGSHFAEVRRALAALPYRVAYTVLNARDYGSPQNRKRLFIVGVRRGNAAGAVVLPPGGTETTRFFQSILEKTGDRKALWERTCIVTLFVCASATSHVRLHRQAVELSYN
jgi:DNA-cytosine methyltransferase